MTVKIFYSYAHEDERFRKRLEKQLNLLKRQGLIIDWYDRQIGAGKEWAHEIDTYLSTANIILLLISPDFMASDFCYGVEMKHAIERHEAKEARVIPIILRPVSWEDTPLSKLQVLPTDGKPVTHWRNLDDAFLDIARGIQKVVKELTNDTETVPQIKPLQVVSPPTEDTEGIVLPITQQFDDEVIDHVKEELDILCSTYEGQVLPLDAMKKLFRELRKLFMRKTFLEKVEDCLDQNWGGRLRAACLTKKVLRDYQTNILQFETPVYRLYEQLLVEVDGYCMGLMGLFKLREPYHTLDDVERYAYNAEEFKNHLPVRLLKPHIPPENIARCDKHLTRIRELVDQLTAEYI